MVVPRLFDHDKRKSVFLLSPVCLSRTKQTGQKRGLGSPSTPSLPASGASAPGTPAGDMAPGQDKAAGKGEGRRKKAKVEEPLTALQKGRDMAGKLLKKKSDSANLALTLQSIPYAEQSRKEMQNFSGLYEKPSCIAGDFNSLAGSQRQTCYVSHL